MQKTQLSRRGSILISFFLILVAFGCSGSNDGKGGITSRVQSSTGTGSGAIALTETSPLLGGVSSFLTGGSGTSGLTSMKYYITSIQICKEMTPTGSAFSNQSGCIELFHGGSDSLITSNGSTPDYAAMMTHAKTLTSGYIDLLDSTARASLNGSTALKAGDGGAYKWGIITWGYPIKITGTVTMSDGVSLNTNDGTYSNYAGGHGGLNTAALDSWEATEAVITLPNGGTWFAFQTPFQVDETKNYSVDLVFNPNGLLKAVNPVASNHPPLSDGTYSMNIPFLNLSPVPHQSTDTVSKETYIAPVNVAGTPAGYHYDIRLELYYITSDTEKTIYGVDVQTVARDSTASDAFSNFQKVSYVTTSGTTLTFKDYNGDALISGFTRGATTGATTTATVACATSHSLAGCDTTLTFTRQ